MPLIRTFLKKYWLRLTGNLETVGAEPLLGILLGWDRACWIEWKWWTCRSQADNGVEEIIPVEILSAMQLLSLKCQDDHIDPIVIVMMIVIV